MAGVDTSIYGQIAPPADPFALTNKLLGMQQSQIQNQLLGRTLEGQQAYQSALSDATDPATGQIDNNKLISGLRGTPGMLLAPGAVQEGQKIAGGNLDLTTKSQILNTSQLATVGGIYGAALQGGGTFGKKEALSGIMSAISSGQIDPKTGNTLMHMVPRDDAGAKAWANSLFLRSLPNSGASGTVPGGVTSSGATISVTPGQFITQSVGAEPPTGATTVPKGGVVTSLPAGAASAADVTGQANAGEGIALQKAADAVSGARAALGNMQSLLPKIATGPNAEAINTAKAGANAVADLTLGKGSGPRFDQDSVAASEEFRKLSGNLIAQQQQALGGTDAGFASGKAQTPNLDLSTLGNKRVLQMLQGNQDAIEAKNTAWQKWLAAGNSPASYGQFAAQFNQSFSPRAFQWARMDDAERKEAKNSMSPKDRSALANALETAASNGWIDRPGASK